MVIIRFLVSLFGGVLSYRQVSAPVHILSPHSTTPIAKSAFPHVRFLSLFIRSIVFVRLQIVQPRAPQTSPGSLFSSRPLPHALYRLYHRFPHPLPFTTSFFLDHARVILRRFCITSIIPASSPYEHGQARSLSPKSRSQLRPCWRKGLICIYHACHESQMIHDPGNPTHGMENPESVCATTIADRVSNFSQYTHLHSENSSTRTPFPKSRKIPDVL